MGLQFFVSKNCLTLDELKSEHPSLKINRVKRWIVFHLWPVKLFMGKCGGWKGYLPFYLTYCKTHGFYVTYPSGYNLVLICNTCYKEKGD